MAARNASHARARIGCSGYDYPAWDGLFYPEGLSHKDRFEFYASVFSIVEVNNTFYNLPEAATVDHWRDRAPPGFRYVLKLSRYGTHMKHLKDPEQWLGRFLELAERLRSFLGPILVQLPPQWGVDPDRLRALLEAAPRRHRMAIECRDPSWLCDRVYEILADANAALVLHDLIEDHPQIATADWVYMRFHGPDPAKPYAGSYSHQALTAAARRIADWTGEGREVFAFFNNDQEAHAPEDARRLQRYVESALHEAGSSS